MGLISCRVAYAKSCLNYCARALPCFVRCLSCDVWIVAKRSATNKRVRLHVAQIPPISSCIEVISLPTVKDLCRKRRDEMSWLSLDKACITEVTSTHSDSRSSNQEEIQEGTAETKPRGSQWFSIWSELQTLPVRVLGPSDAWRLQSLTGQGGDPSRGEPDQSHTKEYR